MSDKERSLFAYAGKRIAFLGASIFQSGGFLSHMRNATAGKPNAPKLFNRGLGGNRSIMAKYLLDDEIFSLQADVCFVHFGVNDMGIWLYDTKLTATDELQKEREERDAVYLQGMREIVTRLQSRDIYPVLCSPIAVNEYLQEDEHIETLADNKEKGDLIGERFYQRKTFQSINVALKDYGERVRRIAEETGCGFCDLFTETYALMQRKGALYGKDGIHLSVDGQIELGNVFLEFLGYGTSEPSLEERETVKEISDLEKLERKIQYVKWAMFNPFLGYDINDLEENVKKTYQEEDLPPHKKSAIEAYWQYGANRKVLLQEIERKMSVLQTKVFW